MNKSRRAQLSKIADQLSELNDAIEVIREEEQEYYDNMPESFQGGEKGDAAQEAIGELENAISDLGNVVDALNGVSGS